MSHPTVDSAKRFDLPALRRVVMLIVGSILLALALFSDHGNMQPEGFYFALLSGIAVGAFNYIILHYLLAKIAGPLAFGRIWCGWACWFGMIFDLLPYPYSRYRRPGRWNAIRYGHFALSLALVIGLWFAADYHDGAFGAAGYAWFAVGLIAYYGIGIGMAFALKDNRAFCKYVCPLAVMQKAGSRFTVLKIAGTASKCDSCNVCVERCPMNVRIPDYILNGERVHSTECTLCLTCINICPTHALGLTVALDGRAATREHIDYVPPKHAHHS